MLGTAAFSRRKPAPTAPIIEMQREDAMQLQFSREELNMVVQVLQECRLPQPAAGFRDTLLDHFIERNLQFSCDELEALGDILAQEHRQVHDQLARVTDASWKHALQVKESLLQHMLDRVIEASAMV